MTASLFEPLTLRGVTLRNRIGVSPMCQYSSTDGFANDWHLVHLGSRAVGGAALVLAEATAVTPAGRISPADLGLWRDEQAEMLARITRFIREQGSVAGVQLAHAGRKASTEVPWRGGAPLSPGEGGWSPLIAPSAVPFGSRSQVPVALDADGIRAVVEAFRDAAQRALQAGFQVIELHGAHGYLMHQFLSPLSNRRTDAYGGSMEKRRRFPLEVFDAVRKLVPREKALGIRLSVTDWVEGGLTVEDTIETARQLKVLGCDFVDVSSGGNSPAQRITVAPGYHVPFAARVKKEAGIKTWAVGVITEPEQAEHIVAAGEADCTAHARAFLLDPRWGWNAARALGVETPPLPLPAARATTILPFKPQPILADAAE